MARRAANRRAQRGVALLGLLAVAVMVFAYVITSRLNAASQFVGIDREHNAKVLSRAKLALIGYMAQQAAMAGENNPGHLPCPEAPANFGTANEGVEASFCAAPAVGRLPWRTLGLEKLVDAAGEPLWYAVSIGWHRPSSAVTLTINSDTLGQLSLDGTPVDKPVALIIAPGPAITVQTSGPCTGVAQTRPSAGPPVLSNYLECGNETGTYVTNSPGNTVNDQVLRVNAADVMPALEAAIAVRTQREIAPALRGAAFVLDSNSPRRWVASSSNPPIYPYAAPFADPATSSFVGASGTYQGLPPFNQAQSFVAYQATPANAVETLGFGYIMSQTCSWETADARLCAGSYHEYDTDPTRPIRIEMTATFTNVAMGLRVLDTANLQVQARDDGSTGPWVDLTPSYRAEMNDGGTAGKPRGSVTIRFWATLPNIDVMAWDTYADYRIRIDRAVIGDHFLLNPATSGPGAATSWFVRNQWHRNYYYAVAQNNTANVLPSVGGCTLASSNCLRFVDPALANDRNIRVLLVLAGRGLDTQSRPSNSIANYVEYQNADGDTTYEQRPMRMSKAAISALNAPWNDRVILVDGFPDPYTPPFPLAVLP